MYKVPPVGQEIPHYVIAHASSTHFKLRINSLSAIKLKIRWD